MVGLDPLTRLNELQRVVESAAHKGQSTLRKASVRAIALRRVARQENPDRLGRPPVFSRFSPVDTGRAAARLSDIPYLRDRAPASLSVRACS